MTTHSDGEFEALPDRSAKIPAQHIDADPRRDAAGDAVVACWRHLIDEGVLSETGLRSIASHAVRAADAWADRP